MMRRKQKSSNNCIQLNVNLGRGRLQSMNRQKSVDNKVCSSVENPFKKGTLDMQKMKYDTNYYPQSKDSNVDQSYDLSRSQKRNSYVRKMTNSTSSKRLKFEKRQKSQEKLFDKNLLSTYQTHSLKKCQKVLKEIGLE